MPHVRPINKDSSHQILRKGASNAMPSGVGGGQGLTGSAAANYNNLSAGSSNLDHSK